MSDDKPRFQGNGGDAEIDRRLAELMQGMEREPVSPELRRLAARLQAALRRVSDEGPEQGG